VLQNWYPPPRLNVTTHKTTTWGYV
jgi:hypothetical protein